MKLSRTILLSVLLAATAVTFVPAAEADTCMVFDPDLEQLVCTPVLVGYCVLYAAGDYKHLGEHLADCATVPY